MIAKIMTIISDDGDGGDFDGDNKDDYGAVDDNADDDDDDDDGMVMTMVKNYFIGLRMGGWIEGCTSQVEI